MIIYKQSTTWFIIYAIIAYQHTFIAYQKQNLHIDLKILFVNNICENCCISYFLSVFTFFSSSIILLILT